MGSEGPSFSRSAAKVKPDTKASEAGPSFSRSAAKVKPDTKASEGPSFSRSAAKVKPDTKASEAPCPGNEECETACSFTVPTNTSMLCCCCEGLPPPEAGWSGWESCTEKKLYNC